jgi:hypothetical protein
MDGISPRPRAGGFGIGRVQAERAEVGLVKGGICRDTQRERDKSNKMRARRTRLQARTSVLNRRIPGQGEEWEGEGGDEEKRREGEVERSQGAESIGSVFGTRRPRGRRQNWRSRVVTPRLRYR